MRIVVFILLCLVSGFLIGLQLDRDRRQEQELAQCKAEVSLLRDAASKFSYLRNLQKQGYFVIIEPDSDFSSEHYQEIARFTESSSIKWKWFKLGEDR